MNNLDQHYIDFYKPKADYFYTEIQKLDLPLDIIKETPALFIPCYGELYEQSLIKFAVMGKETLGWWNLRSAASDPLWGIKEFRDEGPSVWRNQFWHYFAQILGNIYDASGDEILSAKGLFIPSIAWNNCLSIESSKSTTYQDWSAEDFEQLSKIQNLASDIDISNIYDFVKIFRPNIIFYFFRNQSEGKCWEWQKDAFLLTTQNLNDLEISEYKIGETIIFHLPHPNYLVKGHAQAWEMGHHIVERLKCYGLYCPIKTEKWLSKYNCTSNSKEYQYFLKLISENIHNDNLNDFNLIARNAIASVAVELRKKSASMSGVLMIRLLNDIPVLKKSKWQYSEQGMGPLSTIRGAYNFFANQKKNEIADNIALAFTKKDGTYAW